MWLRFGDVEETEIIDPELERLLDIDVLPETTVCSEREANEGDCRYWKEEKEVGKQTEAARVRVCLRGFCADRGRRSRWVSGAVRRTGRGLLSSG